MFLEESSIPTNDDIMCGVEELLSNLFDPLLVPLRFLESSNENSLLLGSLNRMQVQINKQLYTPLNDVREALKRKKTAVKEHVMQEIQLEAGALRDRLGDSQRRYDTKLAAWFSVVEGMRSALRERDRQAPDGGGGRSRASSGSTDDGEAMALRIDLLRHLMHNVDVRGLSAATAPRGQCGLGFPIPRIHIPDKVRRGFELLHEGIEEMEVICDYFSTESSLTSEAAAWFPPVAPGEAVSVVVAGAVDAEGRVPLGLQPANPERISRAEVLWLVQERLRLRLARRDPDLRPLDAWSGRLPTPAVALLAGGPARALLLRREGPRVRVRLVDAGGEEELPAAEVRVDLAAGEWAALPGLADACPLLPADAGVEARASAARLLEDAASRGELGAALARERRAGGARLPQLRLDEAVADRVRALVRAAPAPREDEPEWEAAAEEEAPSFLAQPVDRGLLRALVAAERGISPMLHSVARMLAEEDPTLDADLRAISRELFPPPEPDPEDAREDGEGEMEDGEDGREDGEDGHGEMEDGEDGRDDGEGEREDGGDEREEGKDGTGESADGTEEWMSNGWNAWTEESDVRVEPEVDRTGDRFEERVKDRRDRVEERMEERMEERVEERVEERAGERMEERRGSMEERVEERMEERRGSMEERVEERVEERMEERLEERREESGEHRMGYRREDSRGRIENLMDCRVDGRDLLNCRVDGRDRMDHRNDGRDYRDSHRGGRGHPREDRGQDRRNHRPAGRRRRRSHDLEEPHDTGPLSPSSSTPRSSKAASQGAARGRLPRSSPSRAPGRAPWSRQRPQQRPSAERVPGQERPPFRPLQRQSSGPQGPPARHPQGPWPGPQGPPARHPQGPWPGPQGPHPSPQGPASCPQEPSPGSQGPAPSLQERSPGPQGPAPGPQEPSPGPHGRNPTQPREERPRGKGRRSHGDPQPRAVQQQQQQPAPEDPRPAVAASVAPRNEGRRKKATLADSWQRAGMQKWLSCDKAASRPVDQK